MKTIALIGLMGLMGLMLCGCDDSAEKANAAKHSREMRRSIARLDAGTKKTDESLRQQNALLEKIKNEDEAKRLKKIRELQDLADRLDRAAAKGEIPPE